VNPDPYQAVTDSDIIVSQTHDRGVHWSTPAPIRETGDQFFGWAAYDARGRLRIGYFDWGYDPANHWYGYTRHRGAVRQPALPADSGNHHVVGPNSRKPVVRRRRQPPLPPGHTVPRRLQRRRQTPYYVVAVWTDQRLPSCRLGACGAGQDTFAASIN